LPAPRPDSEPGWPERERHWRRKLGRLQLGAEPLDVQLAKYRRVTWALTVVPLSIGLMFVGLFTAFGRPDLGVLIASVLVIPIVALAWFDYRVLCRRADGYEHERQQYATRRNGGS
jgi:hypothetical protein